MKQKGIKSAAKLSVIETSAQHRVDAPDDLLPHERDLWDRITSSKSVDFFDDGTVPLLTEFCRLKSSLDLVAEQIEDFNPEWFATDDGVKRYKVLSDIRDKEQGRLNALARSLRLTNQSRYQPVTAASRSGSSSKSSKTLWQRN